MALLLSRCTGQIPDPKHSHIFREMKQQVSLNHSLWPWWTSQTCCSSKFHHYVLTSLDFVLYNLQIHDPTTWICSPTNEPIPQIIVLEVVLIQPSLQNNSEANELSTQLLGEWSSSREFQKDQRENVVTGDTQSTEPYSKMVDSDEERSWSASEEEPCTSGYEKHFMPSEAEVLGDSWFPQVNLWPGCAIILSHWTVSCISSDRETGHQNHIKGDVSQKDNHSNRMIETVNYIQSRFSLSDTGRIVYYAFVVWKRLFERKTSFHFRMNKLYFIEQYKTAMVLLLRTYPCLFLYFM